MNSHSLSLHLAQTLITPVPTTTMYPIDKATYDKVNAYHVEFKTGSLTSLHVPDIVEYCSVNPDMVLKCIILGNACDWKGYEVACGHYERHKDEFKF